MPQFQNGAASVHYEIIGSGRPLLLVAGTASDGASWGPLLPLLPDRQLILIDNRGSGRTKIDGPITHSEMIDDCAELIHHLGLGATDVVGHSLGGFLGLGLAALHPNKVNRLVTLGSGGISAKARAVFKELARLYFILPPEDWFRLLYPWLFSDPFFSDEARINAAAAASTARRPATSPVRSPRSTAIHRWISARSSARSSPLPAISISSLLRAQSRVCTRGSRTSPSRPSRPPPTRCIGRRRSP